MKHFGIVGHRGVGKTHLMRHLQKNFPEFHFFSLDQQIEVEQGLSILEIFDKVGEQKFREIETRVFSDLLDKHRNQKIVVDIGGGYLGPMPAGMVCLWVRRQSHSVHSQFPSRPSLDGSIQISKERYEMREQRFKSISDVSFFLREGEDTFAVGEKIFFSALLRGDRSFLLKDYFYTILPKTTELEVNLLKNLGIKGFELRNDKPNRKISVGNETHILHSLRVHEAEPDVNLWDWPLEWGPNDRAPLLSLHTRKKTLEETIRSLPKLDSLIKLAVPVFDYEELRLGHEWMIEDTDRRSFLPISGEGRWHWYRHIMGGHCPINFLKLGQGSAPDQPNVLDILNFQREGSDFAAVIGTPVDHSQTPTFHQNYFAKKQAPVFAIDIQKEEFAGALEFLTDLGLRWVAVTSPLKEKAGELAGVKGPINTLFFDNEKWIGVNTDAGGLKEATLGLQDSPVAVWGGGGTHDSIAQSFKRVSYFSSRTGQLKSGDPNLVPETLIWAVGAKKFQQQGTFPPTKWPLTKVIDLNYTQDSPAIGLSHQMGCQYQSGLVMFRAQARKQQEFWDECQFK